MKRTNANVDWNDELDEQVVKLRAIGRSFSEIGEEMDLSKNTIVGRWTRISAELKAKYMPEAPGKKAAARPKKSKPIPPVQDYSEPSTGPAPQGVENTAQEPAGPEMPMSEAEKPLSKPAPMKVFFSPSIFGREEPCSFPIGDPKHASFHYCNARAAKGKPYCEEHAAIAYARQAA